MIRRKVLFYFCFYFLALGTTCYGQDFIGKTEYWCKKNSPAGVLKPSLEFNKDKICTREIYYADQMATCEKIVEQLTRDTALGWIRINENQWVSNFASQLLVEIHEVKKGCRTQVLRTEWTKELYDLLLQK